MNYVVMLVAVAVGWWFMYRAGREDGEQYIYGLLEPEWQIDVDRRYGAGKKRWI